MGIWFFMVYLIIILLLLLFYKTRRWVIVNRAEALSFTASVIYLLADIKSQSTDELIFDYTWKDCNLVLISLGVILFMQGIYFGYLKNKDLETLQQLKIELANQTHKNRTIKDEYYTLCSDYIKVIFETFFEAHAHTNARVSIYKHQSTHFTLLGRCSDNPRFNKKGLQIYPDDEGFIALGWQHKVFKIFNIPIWKHQGTTYAKFMKEKCQIQEERIKKLTMHSRSFYVYRLDNPNGTQPHGIIVFETISEAEINIEPIQAVFASHSNQIIALLKSMKTLDKT